MQKFTFFWLTGDRDVLEGTNAADALNKAGFGNGALGALDFHSIGENIDYLWDKEKRQWNLTEEAQIRKFGKVLLDL